MKFFRCILLALDYTLQPLRWLCKSVGLNQQE